MGLSAINSDPLKIISRSYELNLKDKLKSVSDVDDRIKIIFSVALIYITKHQPIMLKANPTFVNSFIDISKKFLPQKQIDESKIQSLAERINFHIHLVKRTHNFNDISLEYFSCEGTVPAEFRKENILIKDQVLHLPSAKLKDLSADLFFDFLSSLPAYVKRIQFYNGGSAYSFIIDAILELKTLDFFKPEMLTEFYSITFLNNSLDIASENLLAIKYEFELMAISHSSPEVIEKALSDFIKSNFDAINNLNATQTEECKVWMVTLTMDKLGENSPFLYEIAKKLYLLSGDGYVSFHQKLIEELIPNFSEATSSEITFNKTTSTLAVPFTKLQNLSSDDFFALLDKLPVKIVDFYNANNEKISFKVELFHKLKTIPHFELKFVISDVKLKVSEDLETTANKALLFSHQYFSHAFSSALSEAQTDIFDFITASEENPDFVFIGFITFIKQLESEFIAMPSFDSTESIDSMALNFLLSEIIPTLESLKEAEAKKNLLYNTCRDKNHFDVHAAVHDPLQEEITQIYESCSKDKEKFFLRLLSPIKEGSVLLAEIYKELHLSNLSQTRLPEFELCLFKNLTVLRLQSLDEVVLNSLKVILSNLLKDRADKSFTITCNRFVNFRPAIKAIAQDLGVKITCRTDYYVSSKTVTEVFE